LKSKPAASRARRAWSLKPSQNRYTQDPRRAYARAEIAQPLPTKLAHRHGNPLDAQAFDTRFRSGVQVGGICNWRRPQRPNNARSTSASLMVQVSVSARYRRRPRQVRCDHQSKRKMQITSVRRGFGENCVAAGAPDLAGDTIRIEHPSTLPHVFRDRGHDRNGWLAVGARHLDFRNCCLCQNLGLDVVDRPIGDFMMKADVFVFTDATRATTPRRVIQVDNGFSSAAVRNRSSQRNTA